MADPIAKKGKPKKAAPDSATPDLLHFVEDLKRQWVETIDALPDPFMMVTSDYKIQKANATMAQIADKDIKSIIGQTCYKVFADRSTPCEGCDLKAQTQSKDIQIYEIHNKHNDRYYEVVSKTSRLKGRSDGDSVLHLYRDRTDIMRLEHQLAHKEKLASLGQLAGGFAHEINNPLGGIIVFAQMLLREIDPKSSHYQDIQEIENAAQRCKVIVEGMLDFSRQRPAKRVMEKVNFHQAIESAVKFAEVGHKLRGKHSIVSDLDAAIHEGLGDHNKLIQVILNLCTNGIQAMPNGGTLTVATSNSGSSSKKQLEIRVTDEGHGIKKEHLKKIFDPFFTTKEPGQGTGLGLSIVHGIVEDMGGKIFVESTGRKGTTFTVVLPMTFSTGHPS